MQVLFGVIVAVMLAVLPAGLANAHDRGGGVSFGIIITNDRDGRDDHYGRYDRRGGYGHHYGRNYGLRGCHVERSFGYHRGRRAEIGTTVCYDRFGRPVALANSSHVIGYRYGY